jgi:hypothetical protein
MGKTVALNEKATFRWLLSLQINDLQLSLAERTGLEPATPGVTGRYSNQLNYRSELLFFDVALTHLTATLGICLVGADGIEPPTFAL